LIVRLIAVDAGLLIPRIALVENLDENVHFVNDQFCTVVVLIPYGGLNLKFMFDQCKKFLDVAATTWLANPEAVNAVL
jgi:hypothetical protein